MTTLNKPCVLLDNHIMWYQIVLYVIMHAKVLPCSVLSMRTESLCVADPGSKTK